MMNCLVKFVIYRVVGYWVVGGLTEFTSFFYSNLFQTNHLSNDQKQSYKKPFKGCFLKDNYDVIIFSYNFPIKRIHVCIAINILYFYNIFMYNIDWPINYFYIY